MKKALALQVGWTPNKHGTYRETTSRSHRNDTNTTIFELLLQMREKSEETANFRYRLYHCHASVPSF